MHIHFLQFYSLFLCLFFWSWFHSLVRTVKSLHRSARNLIKCQMFCISWPLFALIKWWDNKGPLVVRELGMLQLHDQHLRLLSHHDALYFPQPFTFMSSKCLAPLYAYGKLSVADDVIRARNWFLTPEKKYWNCFQSHSFNSWHTLVKCRHKLPLSKIYFKIVKV